MDIIEGNGFNDPSSNLGWGCLHFTLCKYPWDRYEPNYSLFSYESRRADWPFSIDMATSLREGKLWIQTCLLCLKIEIVTHPANSRGVGYIHTYIHTYRCVCVCVCACVCIRSTEKFLRYQEIIFYKFYWILGIVFKKFNP